MKQPEIPDPPFDQYSPEEIHDHVDDATNMTPGELRDWKDSDNFETYTDAKSGGQEPEEPIDDAIDLLETPRDEFDDELADEGRELLGFLSRSVSDTQGTPMPGTGPEVSKDTAEDLSWGWDPLPDSSQFPGDRP